MGFERCHPAVNLIYFTAVIGGTVCFRHPVYLAISLCSAFLYSVKRKGRRAVAFGLCLVPLVVALGLFYSSYHHFGVTNLRQNFIRQPDYPGVFGLWPGIGMYLGWGGYVDELCVCSLLRR